VVDGGTVSFGSVAGFFAVLAIATRHSLIQIRHLQRQEGRDGDSSGEAQVVLGAGERFTPIVTSLITIALALAPTVVAGRIAGLEILHPLAVVVIGGLVSIAPLSLFVLPAMYMRFGAGSAPDLSVVLSDRTIDLTALERPEVTSS
jgi:Cu/Ag efflux pump CusA